MFVCVYGWAWDGAGDGVVAKRCVCGVGGCAERDRLRCGCDGTNVAGLWIVVQVGVKRRNGCGWVVECEPVSSASSDPSEPPAGKIARFGGGAIS